MGESGNDNLQFTMLKPNLYFSILLSVLLTSQLVKAVENDAKKKPDEVTLKDLQEISDKNDGEAFVFYIENDARTIGGPGSDQAYSNGFKFSYIYAKDRIPKWAEAPVKKVNVLEKKVENSTVNFGVSLGQQIYTPNNISTQQFLKNDRPYAAWLFLGAMISLKEEKNAHVFELNVGTVGPAALGKEVQNNVHELIDIGKAKGWDNGLKNEVTLQLFYQKRTKLYNLKNLDVVPFYGGGVGNVFVGGHAGCLFRFGINLPADFGPTRPSGSDGDSFVSPGDGPQKKNLSYYVFASGRGNGTARNIFLDGNTFQASHRVKKYPLTFETDFGAGIQYDPYSLVWRFVTKSPEFEERSRFNSFASINFVYQL